MKSKLISILSLSAILLLLLDLFLVYFNEKNDLLVTRVVIKSPRLSASLQHLTVVQISDLHLRKFGYLEKKTIRLLHQISPDFLFVTGDLLGNGDRSFISCLEFFSRVTARYGIWVVLGNSDYVHNDKPIETQHLVEILQKLGVHVLRNEKRKIGVTTSDNSLLPTDSRRYRTTSFWLVGVDDPYLAHDDFGVAANAIPVSDTTICLVHSPDIIDQAVDRQIDLILAGHTHGGQIRFPILGPLITQSVYGKKYTTGLFKIKNTTLYVNHGIGTSGIPIRLFCRPEIIMIKFIPN